MKFNKIKWDGKRVELHWTEKRGPSTEVDQVLKSADQPTPLFRAVFTNFAHIASELLELPESWRDKLRVTGLSINEEEGDGRCGIVITSSKPVRGANSPLILNTPHLREPVKSEERGADGFMSVETLDAIHDAWKAAGRYLNGEREQVEMFPKKTSDDDSTTVSVNGSNPMPLKEFNRRLEGIIGR